MKKLLICLALFLLTANIVAEDLTLDIMFTNDIHGGIDRYEATYMNPEFPPMIGGGGSAATYIKRVRKLKNEKRDNLLLDAGDFFQGHPIGTVSNGESIIKYMNMIGYDALTVGNHEYDVKEEILRKTLSLAKFPILSCNVLNKKTKELIDYVKPYVFFEKMGVKIAVIGVTTTDTELMSFDENIKNVDFVNAKTALQKYIPIVKQKGADIVIVLGHMGLPYEPLPAYKNRYENPNRVKKERRWGFDAQEIAHEVEGIDLLIGGHMHKGFKKPWSDPKTHTLVIQGYAYGSNVGHLMLKIDKETKTLSGYELPSKANGLLVTVFEDEFVPDAEIGPEIERMTAEAEKGMDDIIGSAAIYLSRIGNGPQNLVGNMVCDAMKEAVNADFAFLNLGGIRGDIAKGAVTYRDIFNVMPFDNQIVVLNVSGKKLKEIVEARVVGGRHGLRSSSKMQITVNRKRADNDRVTNLIVNGKPLNPNKIYRVATTDFLLAGNAGLTLLTKIPEEQIERYENSLRKAIEDYFRKNSPVKAVIDDRWIENDNAVKAEYLKY